MGVVWQLSVVSMSLARQMAGTPQKQRHLGSPGQVRDEAEKGSWPVSVQQNLIKASDMAGPRLGADVSMAQGRLLAVKLYRALEGGRRETESLTAVLRPARA